MTVPNPEHLLEQANGLLASRSPGRPRQANLRRAVSTAYYAVFHAALAAAADQYVGAARRATLQYGLVYRSVNHKELFNLCLEVRRANTSAKLSGYAPAGGFDFAIRTFARVVSELKQMRDDADYNPLVRLTVSDVRVAIGNAHTALNHLDAAQAISREAFLTLLLFRAR